MTGSAEREAKLDSLRRRGRVAARPLPAGWWYATHNANGRKVLNDDGTVTTRATVGELDAELSEVLPPATWTSHRVAE